MLFKYIKYFILSYVLLITAEDKSNTGVMVLHRPVDASYDCAFSDILRYDVSFGMGLSDTITLVFHPINDLNYKCSIEVVAQSEDVFIIVVVKFPTSLLTNCFDSGDAVTILGPPKCQQLCEIIRDKKEVSSYYVTMLQGRLAFKFSSNSSVDKESNIYQITTTTARVMPHDGCHLFTNETLCTINDVHYCFTNGVVCDGIKNCGVKDWFDERQEECSLPIEYIGSAPVIAVVAATTCALIIAGRILLHCLPPLTSSYFIFGSNGDNRLCIDPLIKPPRNVVSSVTKPKRISLIPIFTSSSSLSSTVSSEEGTLRAQTSFESYERKQLGKTRGSLIREMTSKIYQKLLTGAIRTRVEQESASDPTINDV